MSDFFPVAFENRMKSTLGSEWPDFLQAHKQTAPTAIRINPYKDKLPEGIKIPWTDYGYYLPERPRFTLDPSFHAGKYYVQEPSSMFIEHILKHAVDLNKPLRVLDLCAAPGGKSTHTLSLLSNDSLLVSNEVIRSRANILAENIQKWGCSNVVVTNSDPEAFQKLPGYFDVIIVDAPCSGEGLFRKDDRASKEWSEEHVTLCSQRQRRILTDVWPALKENGILIYSTCTFNESENEGTLNWLAENRTVEFIDPPIAQAWNIQKTEVQKSIGYRFYPHRVNGEGFFIATIRKLEKEQSIRIRGGKNFEPSSKKILQPLQAWNLNPDQFKFIQQNSLQIQIPAELYDEIGFISTQVHIVSKGTAVAEAKHDKLIPEHAMALSIHLNKNHFPVIELELEEALTYLRKEPIHVGEGERGFALVTFKSTPIGWINQLGNRVNNLYPLAWRIRMS